MIDINGRLVWQRLRTWRYARRTGGRGGCSIMDQRL
jgi:hypothetical protein